MNRKHTTRALIALLALAPLALNAGTKKAIAKVQHALGWDTINLKTIEADSAGRPTLEKDENAANRIERKTSYYDNGKKSEQVTKVESKENGKLLYHGKKNWDAQGEASYLYEEDASYAGERRQGGTIVEKRYAGGKLTKDVKKKYSSETGEWGVAYAQSASYYDDGDLKERVTERPAHGEKKLETWGERKGATGRDKVNKTWDDVKSIWN